MTSTTFTMSIDGSGVAHWARRMYNFGKMTDVGKYYPPNKRESQARKLLSGFIPPLTGKQKNAILVGDATLVGIAGEGHDGVDHARAVELRLAERAIVDTMPDEESPVPGVTCCDGTTDEKEVQQTCCGHGKTEDLFDALGTFVRVANDATEN